MSELIDKKANERMEKLVSLCKRRGFIFQSSEIYGGINGFWDYGPLGTELKRNVKESWWQVMTRQRDDVAGLDASIIMHPRIWEASGHTSTFSDPMADCLLTRKRFRSDQIEPQSGTVYHFTGAVDGGEWKGVIEGFRKSQESEINLATPEGRAAMVNCLLEKLFEGRSRSQDSDDVLRKTVEYLVENSASPIDANLQKAIILLPAASDFAEHVLRNANEPYAVLVVTGKHPEYARKVARQFYHLRGLPTPVLLGERTEEVQNTTRYNPENGGLLTDPRPFNLMLKTCVGPVESQENIAYLRPETAQAIFVQFKNVAETARQKPPFGICQIGKAFRNEVNPRNYIFRSREFEQMELEFFIKPDEAVEAISGNVAKLADLAAPSALDQPQSNWGWEVWHKYWVEQRIRYYESIGLPRASLEEYWQKPEELAHYAKATVDILYPFAFGTQELEGVAARGDFDLSQHQRCAGKPMTVFDEDLKTAWAKLDADKQQALSQRYYEARLKYLTKAGEPAEKAEQHAREDAAALAKGSYLPHVIEPSAGVDRLILALLTQAYHEEETVDDKGNKEVRVVLKFHPRIAPIKAGVFPLLKNRPELVRKAREVRDLLRPHLSVFYDDAGAIGRRYRRQDEAGTPFGVTIDFDTLGEKPELLDTVTLRDRDTMLQTRVKIEELVPLLLGKIR